MEGNIKDVGRMGNSMEKGSFYRTQIVFGEEDCGVKERESDGLMIQRIIIRRFRDFKLIRFFLNLFVKEIISFN